MADMNELYSALLKADAAGDTESARTLAGYIQSQQAAPAGLAALDATPRGRRPEDVGFLEGAGASLKKGLTSFGDVASGYGLAGESLTGSRAEVQAKMDAIKREAQKIEETPGLAFADMQRLYKERGLLDALAQLPKYATEQILQSAPQMAVPLAVGAGAGALSGPLAPIVGPVAGVAAYGAQQFGNFMQRQGQEAKTPEDLSVARAAGTAAATAPIGYFVDRFTTGLGGMGEKGLIEVGKELAKRKAAGEIGAAGVAAGVAKQAGKGAATGFIAEAPTEVLESVAERYQAGLPLTDDKAKQEYLESFMGAGVAGGAIGGGSRAVSGTQAYKQAQVAQAEEAKAEAEKQAVAEAAQVAQPVIEEPAGAPAVAAQPEPVQDVNAPSQDREAMLKELEDQLTAIGEEPPSITMLQSPVAEKQQPVAEAPVVESVVEETPVEVKAEAPVSEQEMDPKERLRRANVSMFNAQRMLANGQITADQYDDLKRQYGAIKLRASDIAQRATQPIVPSVEPKGEYKEAKSLDTFFANYKDDKKRLDNLPKYGQPEVKQVVAELNQAIQKVTDAINAKGYSADAIKHKVPADVRPLFNQFSTLTGGGSRLLLESERVGNNKKLASPEKLAKAIAESQADVANAYQFLGLEPEAVAPTPVAPAPARKAAKETPLRKASYAKNPFMTFLADQGLYHVKGKPGSLKSEFSKDKQIPVSGHGFVFRASGKQLDELLPLAIQDGYLPPDATEPQLYSLVQKAIAGQKVEPVYSAQGVEDTAAKYEERMAEPAFEERTGQTDAEWHGMSEQEYMDLMAREVAAVSDADFAELDQAINELSDAPAGNMSVRAAMEALGFTEQEIQDEENRNAPKADEAVAGEQTQGDEASQAAPTLELEAQTAEELKSKQDEIDRLTKENERLAKQAEAKAKADAERDEFVLTGSDRAADVAAAQGQQDIFNAMEEEPPALAEKPKSNALVTFTHKTDTEPGKGQVSGYYPGTYSYETGADVGIPAKGGKNEFTGELQESNIYTLKDADQLKREASNAGFEYRQASGNSEIRYLQSLGYKAMRRGPEIIVFDAKDANFKKAKPEEKIVAEEVVGPAEKPAAPQLTREPVTIEGQFTEVGEEKQRALITDQTKKLTEAQTSTLEKFYGFARDTEEFANAVRQDVVNFITKGATYVNGKIRAIIRSMANGVLSVAVAFNPQFVSMPYTIAVPQYETRIEQVMQEVPASVQKQMSEDAKRAYATIYPAIKGELQANDKFFIVADKQTANTFVFNPDGSPFMQSKTLFGAGIGDFIKGNNNIVSNRITPAGLFDLGLRDAKRSVDEAATAGEYDFGKVFVLDKSQKGSTGLYSTTIMHSVWTKEADAKQRLAALQKPGAEDSRYSFGCINVDKETYGKLVTNNLAQMDGAKIFIVPENGKDVMSFVNGEATYSTDIIRQRAEPVTKDTKQEVQRAAETAEAERTVAAKEEEFGLFDIERTKKQDRADKIREYSGVQRRRTNLEKKVIAGEATIDLQRDLTRLKDTADDLKADIDASKEPRRSARNFFADATKAWDNGHISDEVYETIKLMFEKHPTLLDGLKLSVRQGPEGSTAAGEFKPYSRFINLYKDTRGVENASTIRHEITHSLEQMMDASSRKAVIDAWYADMAKAMRKFQDKEHQAYFKAVLAFFDKPTVENQRAAMKLLPSYEMYQYLNPSEYWAVNAEQLMGRQLGGTWGKFVNAVSRMFEGMKKMFGFDNKSAVHKAFATVMSGTHERLDKKVLANYVKDAEVTLADINAVPPKSYQNYKGQELPPAEWDNLADSKLDTLQYKIVDKQIDTKRVIENIKKAVGDIADKFNAYIKEELYHGRTAKGVHDFLQKELLPLTKEMKAANVTIDEFDEYLHNRHAEEYNNHINKINPDKKELQDKGSGVSTKDARAYLAGLSDAQKATFESLAARIDKIVTGTQDMLVDTGIESKETIDAWRQTFPFYVPLKRDNLEYVNQGSGVGSGYGSKGGVSKRATGSLKDVIDIVENIAKQREQAIMKSEKARVGRALYGLAIQNPNPKFWLPINPDAIKNKDKLIAELEDLGLTAADAANIAKEPVSAVFNKKTGMVEYAINPLLRNSDNVFPIRINGQDRFIIFNGSDPRAKRMVESLKNLDAEQMGIALGTIGEVTRFMASVNTQYNPVFGAWNFLRDVQGAALNLTTTDIAGEESKVLKGVFPALKSIYSDLRSQRAGKEPKGEWQELFERYQKAGGSTGYKEQFSKGNDKPGIVSRELGKLDRGNVRQAADAVFNWLSDYNDAMENAVRLSAFKVALDKGLSEDKAASLAKNLTVNFNRKGAASPTLQALYAFFNASVQGTKRLAETLQGPAGKKIVAGGFTIGAIQAIALAMAGYDDDEPPQFLKDKNLILPMPGGDYLIVPMPMGFNIFPGIGRLTTEYILGQAGLITGAKGLGDKSLDVTSLVLDSFNPLGSGSLLQIVSPTAFDPLAAIQSNKDAFGRPISKEDRATSPTPGFMRSREGATWLSKNIAELLNYVSSPSGTKYTKGKISPTADQLDYLAGQYTGGVGRELVKAGKYAAAAAKGETEDLPSYSVPIVGKAYGETTTPAAIASKFYLNVTELAQHENEIKQRMKNKEDVREYRAEHPETRFINRVNYIENQITALNKQKKALQEKDAPAERIKKIDEQKTALMKGLNDQIKRLQQ